MEALETHERKEECFHELTLGDTDTICHPFHVYFVVDGATQFLGAASGSRYCPLNHFPMIISLAVSRSGFAKAGGFLGSRGPKARYEPSLFFHAVRATLLCGSA